MIPDLCVVGGGSGGFGAALAAARQGLSVCLIERGPMLGGTSTLGGVNTWEPGSGGPGFPAELYRLLARQPNTIGVSRSIKHWTSAEPWGWSRCDPQLAYRSSLRRSGLPPDSWTRVTFEPEAMAAAMAELLRGTGRVELRLGASFIAAEAGGDRLRSIVIEAGGRQERVTAGFFVDATGQLEVARAVGCETYLGCEPASMYHEPGAPRAHLDRLNGVTLCLRVTPTATPGIEPLPAQVPDVEWRQAVSITEYPCGDLNLNPLPVMEGFEFHRLGEREGRRLCEQRVYQFWRWLQRDHGFDRYRLQRLFPFMGVREGPRLVGRVVLTENEVRAGCSGQANAARWITLADHALDVHGEGHLCRELREPYGIPYDCLLPREFSNLAIACRGASFSHIAAASCRLSRTVMQLGHAAGLAVAVARGAGQQLPEVAVNAVQALLRADDVAIDPKDERFPQALTQ
jgi:hypothetical protein